MRLDTLLIGTRNLHKAAEIRAMLADVPIGLRDLADYPACADVEEDEPTLEGNALKKARAAHRCSGLPAMADDSGLEVEYLLGEPGVRSARYAGEEATYADNNRLLLARLGGVPARRRGARFRTVIALVTENLETFVEGICAGTILFEPRGKNGFGYDPLFRPEGSARTFAEMTAAEKNLLSHRARAVEQFKNLLRNLPDGKHR